MSSFWHFPGYVLRLRYPFSEMKLIPVLGVCTILIVIPAAANQRHKDYKTYKGGVEGRNALSFGFKVGKV